MRSYDTLILNAMKEQRTGAPGAGTARLAAAQTELSTDADVLNYALTLEHLEAAFYQLTGNYDLGEDAFGNPINDWLMQAGEQEAIHVTTLTDAITQLGAEPVAAAEYDFSLTDYVSFLNTAATLENIGVSAYDGAAQFLTNRDLVTAVGAIVAVEARHASYLNLLTQGLPFPAAFESPLTPDEVLEAAGGFIVSSN